MAHSRFKLTRLVVSFLIIDPVLLLWNHFIRQVLYMLTFPLSEIFLMAIDKDRGSLELCLDDSSESETTSTGCCEDVTLVPQESPGIPSQTTEPVNDITVQFSESMASSQIFLKKEYKREEEEKLSHHPISSTNDPDADANLLLLLLTAKEEKAEEEEDKNNNNREKHQAEATKNIAIDTKNDEKASSSVLEIGERQSIGSLVNPPSSNIVDNNNNNIALRIVVTDNSSSVSVTNQESEKEENEELTPVQQHYNRREKEEEEAVSLSLLPPSVPETRDLLVVNSINKTLSTSLSSLPRAEHRIKKETIVPIIIVETKQLSSSSPTLTLSSASSDATPVPEKEDQQQTKQPNNSKNKEMHQNSRRSFYDDYSNTEMPRYDSLLTTGYAGGSSFDYLQEQPRYRQYADDTDVNPLNRKRFSDSYFYETRENIYPTVQDQRAIAKRVALSFESPKNFSSRGYFRFMERKSRADVWTFDEKRRERDFLMVPPFFPDGTDNKFEKRWASEPYTARMPEKADVYETYSTDGDETPTQAASDTKMSSIRRRFESYQHQKQQSPKTKPRQHHQASMTDSYYSQPAPFSSQYQASASVDYLTRPPRQRSPPRLYQQYDQYNYAASPRSSFTTDSGQSQSYMALAPTNNEQDRPIYRRSFQQHHVQSSPQQNKRPDPYKSPEISKRQDYSTSAARRPVGPPPPPRPPRSSSAQGHLAPSTRSYAPMTPIASINPQISDKYLTPTSNETRRPRYRGLSATDYEELRFSADKCEHTNLSPELCFSLTAEMKSRNGRAGEMFAQRARRANKFVIDDTNAKTSSSSDNLYNRNPIYSNFYSDQQGSVSTLSATPTNEDAYGYSEDYYYPRPDSYEMANQGRKISVLQRSDNTAPPQYYQDDYDSQQQTDAPYYYDSQPQQPHQSHISQRRFEPANQQQATATSYVSKGGPSYLEPGSHNPDYTSHTSSTVSVHSSRDRSRGSTPKPGWQQSGKSVDPDFLAHLSQTVPKSPSYISPALQEELHPFPAK